MSLDAVREPQPRGAGAPASPLLRGPRGRWELVDVRHPLHLGLRVDRVVVCPSGVHVVTVLPAADQGGPDAVLVTVGHTAADVVRSLLPPRYRDRVRPVLCVTAAEPVADLVDGVLVTTAETLEHIVGSSPVVLSTSEAHEVAGRLEAGLVAAPGTTPGPAGGRPRRSGLLLAAAAVAAAAAVLAERVVLALP